MTRAGRAADALLEASVAGSFSRVGLAVRSRLLPEFTGDQPRPAAGRVAVVTGATSGLGLAAARELVRCGWAVHFLARDPARAAAAQHRIAGPGKPEEPREARRAGEAGEGRGGAGGSRESREEREPAEGEPGRSGEHGAVSYGLADLEDLDSVRAFAREFRDAFGRLDVLVHAAGAIHPRYAVNRAGIELTVADQVVAPFALTRLLLPALLAAAPARVITVSSGGMYTQRLDPAALAMTPPGYRGVTAYARAKRAQVALSGEWARRIDPGRGRLPRHAPRLGRHARAGRRAAAVPAAGAPDPAHPRAGRRHHRLAGHRRRRAAGHRAVLARPASAVRVPAAVDRAG